jgi:hypothetical protein
VTFEDDAAAKRRAEAEAEAEARRRKLAADTERGAGADAATVRALRDELAKARRALVAARREALARSVQHHAEQSTMRDRTARLRNAVSTISAAGSTPSVYV